MCVYIYTLSVCTCAYVYTHTLFIENTWLPKQAKLKQAKLFLTPTHNVVDFRKWGNLHASNLK